MYPTLFGVEFLDTYSIMMIVGMFSAVLLFRFTGEKRGVSFSVYRFYALLAVVSIAVALLCAYLFQAVYNWIATGQFQLKGLTFMGGLIGGVLTFVLGSAFVAKGKTRQSFWMMANCGAPCLALGHAFGRVGCFLSECCYGKPTNLPFPFGVVFPYLKTDPAYRATGGRAVPSNLYEAIFLFALFAVLAVLLLKYKKTGIVLIAYAFSYGIFRFLLEFSRGDNRGSFIPGLSPSQWTSILLLLIATAVTVYVFRFRRIPLAGKIPAADYFAAVERSDSF